MLLTLHETLRGIGRQVAALVLIIAMLALHAVPVGALILAGVYAGLWAAGATGGGSLVAFPVIFTVWGLGAIYVAPFVSPKLAAAMKAMGGGV